MSKTDLFGFPLEENYNENVEEKEEESSNSKEELKKKRKKNRKKKRKVVGPKKKTKWTPMNQIHGSHYVKKSGKSL